MLSMITNFFLTLWIWSITGGLHHLVFNFLLLWFFLKLWDHITIINAALTSFALTVLSFIVFFLFVWGLLINVLNISYIQPEDTYQGSYHILNTSLLLAFVYAVIQIAFVALWRQYHRFNIIRHIICILCSNAASALLVYKLNFKL